MPVFKIRGCYVEAETQELAEQVASGTWLAGDKSILFRQQSGSSDVIRIPEGESVDVWTKSGNSIRYAGKISADAGDKIMRHAVEGMALSDSERAKLGNATKKARIARKHANDSDVIGQFESTIPEIAKAAYADICLRMQANTSAYKMDIINAMSEKGVTEVRPHNWLPILTWFRDKVLVSEASLPVGERRSFYQLRAAFATAAARMVKEDVRNASTMRMVDDGSDHDDDFWNKYAQDKAGS